MIVSNYLKFFQHTKIFSLMGDYWNWDAVILLAADNMETISEIREIIAGTGGIDEIETEVILNWLHDRIGIA